MKIEDFNRAKEIMHDLEILEKIKIPDGASSKFVKSFNEWISLQKYALKEEFEDLGEDYN